MIVKIPPESLLRDFAATFRKPPMTLKFFAEADYDAGNKK